ncbi:type II toxin-antitoxin system antitoxin SocA domain-containing protein [Bacillus sp. AFS096315]|uniref:Panacea domain-containing protein n=1 Tax=Bacillus sp. AFS096315 TaxID=2033517 RepID=UPI000BEC825D|nr:type II toxin-antitoxin system antitoxin SocA domain-containing protein [Bacillus sp. AFS096315]PEC50291.1 hypothetical protein CON00_06995 [Bacillus sp. AFS096315]
MNVNQVALYFLYRSMIGRNYEITHLKLQKLVYYAQAWSMAINGRPIFQSDLEAWLHGPVSRELYMEYRHFGFQVIPPVNHINFQIDPVNLEVLDGVWDLYGEYDGKYLETLTHQEDPWRNAWNLGMNNVINLQEMQEYYGQMLQIGAN